MTIRSPAFRYHGAKFRLAKWIMQFFPPHRCYIEPYGGAAGVLLQKPRSEVEIYNDLDGDVVNFFLVVRDPVARRELIQACIQTPYARGEFDLAWEPTTDRVERARRLAVRAQMGFGSAGATKGSTGFRIDTRRKYGTAQQLWAEYPEAIAAAGQRFAGVLIENREAIQVMLQHDSPDTLFFVDPPYMHETRAVGADAADYYKHEMSDTEHDELLTHLRNLDGAVVLSGYANNLYSDRLSDWTHFETTSRIASNRGCAIRVENAWLNPRCVAQLELRTGLFEARA